MSHLQDQIAKLDCVERAAPWKDRLYLTLAAVRGSRHNADLRTKIWLRADTLTIEIGKGYNSDAFIAQLAQIEAVVTDNSGKVVRV
jgi:hypothetical protein